MARGPSFRFVQLVFEFIEALFDVPAHAVKMSDEPWWESHLIGDEFIGNAFQDIPEDDAAEQMG